MSAPLTEYQRQKPGFGGNRSQYREMVPQDLLAEKTVQGAALFDRQCRELLLQQAERSYFYTPAGGRVFDALCRYPSVNGNSVDLVRLADLMGGQDPELAIAEVTGYMCTAADLPYHIGKLKDAAARRAAIETANNEINRAYDIETPFTDAANTFKWEVDKLSPKRFFEHTPKD